MIKSPTVIGKSPWSREQMKLALAEFADLYASRPIKNNAGGMQAPHLFLTWFMMRELSPKLVVESGIWQGLGTWIIEKACPNAQVICMDPDLSRLIYRSETATYTTVDFSKYDFPKFEPEHTVVFFDDHQNAFERLRTANALGFRHLIFEDNYYPVEVSDCYSLKLVLAGEGWHPERTFKNALKGVLGKLPKSIPANDKDMSELRAVVDVYEEQPPVYLTEKTRWGTPWPPTAEPLMTERTDSLDVYWDEATSYTWMAYVKLKHN